MGRRCPSGVGSASWRAEGLETVPGGMGGGMPPRTSVSRRLLVLLSARIESWVLRCSTEILPFVKQRRDTAGWSQDSFASSRRQSGAAYRRPIKNEMCPAGASGPLINGGYDS